MRRWSPALRTLLVVALLFTQYLLWRQQTTVLAGLRHLAEKIEGEGPAQATGRPAVSYQFKMDTGLTKEDLRTIIREEMAHASGTSAAATPPENVRQANQLPSVDSDQAFQSARHLIDQALTSHVWDDEQAKELGTLRRQMTPDQLRLLMADLIPAVNSQQVRVQFAGPLF